MHDDGEQVMTVGEAVASRLVDEDAVLLHCYPENENAGENVPGTWKPSYRGKPSSIYHGSSGNSRALEVVPSECTNVTAFTVPAGLT